MTSARVSSPASRPNGSGSDSTGSDSSGSDSSGPDTSGSDASRPAESRPTRAAFTSFRATVARLERRGPNFLRVTLAGDELANFYGVGLDQRLKVVFPHPETGLDSFPRETRDWYTAWREQDAGTRCAMRTYTLRRFRPDRNELDIDFVVHGDSGPATRWANRAEIGQELIVVGPDSRTVVPGDTVIGGVEFAPGDARRVLLAGDETAAPAICSIVESLPSGTKGRVFIEVESTDDICAVDAPGGVTICWLARDTRPGLAHGEALSRAVRAWVSEMVAPPESERLPAPEGDEPDPASILWDVPDETDAQRDIYAWIAGEAGCVTSIRRFLVREAGLDRQDVAFMGYWREGRAEN